MPLHISIPAIKLNSASSATSAVNGNLYLCDTTAGGFTVTLPRPVQNHVVMIKDQYHTFNPNPITVAQFGSEKIENVAASYVLGQDGDSAVFISNGVDWFIFAEWNMGIAAAVSSSFANFVALGAITANDTVYLSAPGQVSKGDVSGGGNPSQIIGIALGTVLSGATVTVQFDGAVTTFAGLTAGARYYGNPATPGGVTTVRPVLAGATIVQIGIARTATSLGVAIQQLGRVAA